MSLPFDADDVITAVFKGRITQRKHPTLNYWIYNYSPEIQYTNQWDDVTLNCRGLILDENFEVVARPWKKFFNLGQVDLPIQFDTPVEVMDKADGSLGILYPTPDGYAIATRGSFESEQAIHATEVWKREYAMYHDFHLQTGYLDDYTFLFEIVFPANRIVLDYKGMDDLILLGAVQKSNGYYIGPQHAESLLGWTGPVVDVMPFNSISDALGKTDRKNAEGYVIRSHNFMVKVKQPDYLELHRLVTNASPKTVWEQLKSGKSKSEIVSAFPDEFHDYIGGMIDPLVNAFESRLQEILAAYQQTMDALLVHNDYELPSRREIANAFSERKDKRYFFLLLDSKPMRDVLWSELKPREAKHD